MKTIIKRKFSAPLTQSYFIFGPRGVGKSRFIKQAHSTATVIDLLLEKNLSLFLSQPERLETLVMSLPKQSTVVIDEVQRAPILLSTVHHILESDDFPIVQFILTGSSARKLKTQGVDLLAGRALVKRMHPFMAAELGKQFSLNRALSIGLVPLIWFSENPEDTLQSYIGVYLKEEVKQEGLVKKIEAFSKFLEVMCFSHAEIINLSNISRESSIRRSTLDGYMSILEDLLLGYRLSSFKIKNRKQTVESEKFYYFDVGIFKSLCPSGVLDNPEQFKGQALEGLVAQHLRAWTSYRNKKEQVYFWRTTANNEVDFIVYGPETLMAIEVKSAKTIKNEFLSGLKSFGEDYPKAERYLLYMGKEEHLINGIRCLPIEKFLLNLK